MIMNFYFYFILKCFFSSCLKMENEYGNMEGYYGVNGEKYVTWLSNYAISLSQTITPGIPWVMCQQVRFVMYVVA